MAARKRDYRAEYRRRVERAQARGFESPYQETSYRRLVRNAPEQTVSPQVFRKQSTLRKFGLTESEFEKMRRENRAHTPEGARKDGRPASKLAYQIQKYNTAIDEQESNWSVARVGYIKSFNDAVVNPDTNFWNRPDRNSFIESNVTKKSARYMRYIRAQLDYLVRFGGFIDSEEFDDRYVS